MRKQACILNPFRKKPVVGETPTLRNMAYLNALLVDFKCRDDVADGGKKGRKALRGLIARRVRQARKALPEVADVLDRAHLEQCKVEAALPDNWHVAADPFGEAVRRIIQLLAGKYYIGELGMVGYLLGQYVYLLDAIDDYDADGKKHQYNPLRLRYGADTKRTLLAEHGEELRSEVDALIALVKDNYQRIPVFCTEGIITNTLWMGLKARYNQVTEENVKCLKTHTKF